MQACLTGEQLEKYDRGELGEIELRRLREHLAECDPCRTAYDRWRSLNSPPAAEATLAVASVPKRSSSPAEKAPRYLPRIEGYRITGVLGQGGMGIVYRAVQSKLNRAVALKVLPSIVGSASPSAVQRFRREATAAARLHHTHIVPIYDFGECRDAHYYAMELIDGQPLNKLIKLFAEQKVSTASPARLAAVIHESTTGTAFLPPVEDDADRSSFSASSSAIRSSSTGRGRAYFQQAARWIADAADALHYAHGQGIIHRDIKPGNLILSTDGRIMIADFGLAKSSEEESVTITGALIGTIRYLSPEQAMAKRMTVDHRTDIYSLGATMYELLCFQPAFPGEDDKQVLAAIITRDPASPRKIAPHVPAELETICLKSLEKSADRRYATARALAEDLRRYLNDLPIVAKRPGPVSRVLKYARRNRAMTVGVVAVLLIVTTGGFLWRAVIKGAEESRRADAERVESFVADGDRDFAAQKWDAAAQEYGEAIALNANSVPALANLATVKKEQYNASLPDADPKLLDDAVTLLTRVLALDPKRTRAWNNKGVVLKMQGKWDEAAVAYGEATDLSPTDPYTWANLAAVNVLRGQLDKAMENLRTAADFAKPDEPLSCGVLRDLAVVQFRRGEAEAADSIDHALECNPGDEKSLLVRARMQLTGGGRINAEAALFDAASADRLSGGKNALVKRYLALAYLRLGRFDEAITHARAALSLQDLPAYDRLIIAAAEGHLGHADAAKSAVKEAPAVWPPKLQKPGEHEPSAVKGFLWFESADELLRLRDEAELVLAPPKSPP